MSADILFWFNIFIISLFLCVIVYIWCVYLSSCKRNLDALTERLGVINERIGESIQHLHEEGNSRKVIAEIFSEDPLFAKIWMMFDKTLIAFRVHTVDEDVITYHSTVDADNYINFASVTSGVNIAFWQNIGGIFTGIGILGTFIGLTSGLMYIGYNDINTESMAVLMEGLGTAFFTSLIGVVFALVFNYCHKESSEKLQKEIDITVEYIETLFGRMTVEKLLVYNYEKIEEQTAQFQSFSSTLAVSIGDAFEEKLSNSDLTAALGNVDKNTVEIKQFLESDLSGIISGAISTQLEPIFRDLQESISKLSNSGLEAVAEGIQNSAGKELGDFAQTLQSLSDNISGSLHELQQTSGTVKADLNDSISAVISKLDDSVNRIVEQTEHQSNALQGTSSDIANDLKDCVKTLLMEIGEQQKGVLGNNSQLMEKTQEEMNKLLLTMQENVNAISQETAQQRSALESTTSQISNEIQNSMKASLEGIEASIKSMVDQAKTQQLNMEKASDNVGKALENNMSTTIAAMAAQVAAIKEQTDNQINSIKAQTAAQQNSMVETSNNVNIAIADAMDNIKKQVIDIMEAYNAKNKEANDSLMVLIGRIRTDLMVQQESLQKINTTVSGLIKDASATADKFGLAAKPVEAASNNLSAQLQKSLDANDRLNAHVMSSIDKLKSVAETNTSGIKAISTEFMSARRGMEDTAREYREVSKQIDNILQSVNNSLGEYNVRILEQYKKSLEMYVKQQSQAYGNLGSLVEELADALVENNNVRN